MFWEKPRFYPCRACQSALFAKTIVGSEKRKIDPMETGTFGTHGTLYFSVILHIIRIKAGAWRFVSRVVGNKPSFSCVRTYRSEAVLTKRRIRAIHEKCHFSRPQFTIVASLRCRLRRSFVHWDSSCLYPALRAAGYVPMRPVVSSSQTPYRGKAAATVGEYFAAKRRSFLRNS